MLVEATTPLEMTKDGPDYPKDTSPVSEDLLVDPKNIDDILVLGTSGDSSSATLGAREEASSRSASAFIGESQTPLVRLPIVGITETLEPESFQVLQQWEGYVLEVKDKQFIGRLVDKNNKENDLETEFSMDEIDQEDHYLVQEGAVFYWHMGYLDRRSGRLSVSNIRFRRIPTWSKKELDAAKTRAKAILDRIEE